MAKRIFRNCGRGSCKGKLRKTQPDGSIKTVYCSRHHEEGPKYEPPTVAPKPAPVTKEAVPEVKRPKPGLKIVDDEDDDA